MRRDAQTYVSEAQAVTAAAFSTNWIDKGALAAQFQTAAKPLIAHTIVTTALTDGGSNTGTDVFLAQADDGSGTNAATVGNAMYTFAAAAAVGTHKKAMVPIDTLSKEAVGVKYVPNGANLTGGAFTTWFTNQRELTTLQAASFTVSH